MQVCVSAAGVEQRALASAVSSTDVIARTAGGSLGSRRRCGDRVSDLLLHRRRGGPASAGTLGQPGSRFAPNPTSGHLTRPLSGDDDRGAVNVLNVRLQSCWSRQVLFGDSLAIAGVQRAAVQRPPTLRLIKRVPQPDCIHTRVEKR